MTYQLVVFDFDGTIADTFDLVLSNFNAIIASYGLKQLDPTQAHLLKKLPLQSVIKQSNLPIILMPLILLQLRRRMAKELIDVAVFPEFANVLQQLHDKGINLGILTSNSKSNVFNYLTKQKLNNHFTFIISQKNLFNKHKALSKIAQTYNLEPHQVIYVGDEVRDVKAAKKAGVTSVAATWGFNSREIIEMENPDYIIENISQLINIVVDKN